MDSSGTESRRTLHRKEVSALSFRPLRGDHPLRSYRGATAVISDTLQHKEHMHRIVRTRSTSPRTSKINQIVLREGKLSRLIFVPVLVQNQKDPDAGIDGYFRLPTKGGKGYMD
jgi:hypothetical protein